MPPGGVHPITPLLALLPVSGPSPFRNSLLVVQRLEWRALPIDRSRAIPSLAGRMRSSESRSEERGGSRIPSSRIGFNRHLCLNGHVTPQPRFFGPQFLDGIA
jgi:hypothetical protein